MFSFAYFIPNMHLDFKLFMFHYHVGEKSSVQEELTIQKEMTTVRRIEPASVLLHALVIGFHSKY